MMTVDDACPTSSGPKLANCLPHDPHWPWKKVMEHLVLENISLQLREEPLIPVIYIHTPVFYFLSRLLIEETQFKVNMLQCQ